MNDQNQLQWKTVNHFEKELFLNLCERQNLTKTVKKALNVNFSKSQQSTVNVRSFNVHALSLDTHSLEISNLKKKNWREKLSICENKYHSAVEDKIKTFVNHHVWSEKQDH